METQTVIATLFVPPHGGRREIEIKNVKVEDAVYIKAHSIKVSLEELGTGDTAIYFDDGKHIDNDPAEDPDEIIILARDGKKSCEQCFEEGVKLLRARATV